MLNSFIVYRYNDMIGVLAEGMHGIDRLSSLMFNLLVEHLGPISSNNIFMLLSLISNFFFFVLLLVRKLNKFVAISISIAFAFSIYFFSRIISLTPGLYFIIFFPLVVFVLAEGISEFILGILVFLVLSISYYYGFFSFVLVGVWYLFDLISKKIPFKDFLKKIILFTTPVLLGILIFFFPLLKSNLPILGGYSDEQSQKQISERTTVYRPIEDWYNLSFRPWYFFIPPKSSIFFGDLSRNIHQKIENTGYYLADDYMEEEMAGSYMGWHFLIGLGVVGTLLLLKRYKNIEFKTFKTVYENKEMILRSFFIIFCILLISGPPSFTIHGVEIYTPTYLLYYIVPVFRTLVRWAVVIYLLVLIINAFLVQDLYDLMKKTWQKVAFIVGFLGLNFVIFAIKIPVININNPLEEVAFVKEKFPGTVSYAVYPKGDYYSIFWVISHEDRLINPVDYVNYETGFDADEFSKQLITPSGMEEFLINDPQYLIYYKNKISEDDMKKITEINPEIHTGEDIAEFFSSYFGEPIYSQNEVYVYLVAK